MGHQALRDVDGHRFRGTSRRTKTVRRRRPTRPRVDEATDPGLAVPPSKVMAAAQDDVKT